MADSQDHDLGLHNAKDNSVVADAKFPISGERAAQGFAEDVGMYGEFLFYSQSYATRPLSRDARNINIRNQLVVRN